MPVAARFQYYRRIFRAYVARDRSHLTFWHETPEENSDAVIDALGPYYMSFRQKAEYPGPFDRDGIPLLDYRGTIGQQYNPIAIAQYGLANYNQWKRTGDEQRRVRFMTVADWLVANLEINPGGLHVWNHKFDWEYRSKLVAPWYSALAQGQGISVLVRAHESTGDAHYLNAAQRALVPMKRTVEQGGVQFIDREGNTWLEEYIVDPPTHILNGFLWALWGVHDFWLATHEPSAKELMRACLRTLARNVDSYDAGYWSLYEHSGTRMKMLASNFYHKLHIVQLRVTAKISGQDIFAKTADRWESYLRRGLNRKRALAYKSVFKILYY